MFDFVRKLTTPSIDVIRYGEGVLKFRAGRNFALGTTFDVIARLPNGKKVDLQVQVVQHLPDGTLAGRPLGPAPSVEVLEKLFLPDPRASKEQMYYKTNPDDSTQHVRSYAMRSAAFKRFKGITAEISLSGAKVYLDGPVEEQKVIQVEVDLDDVELPPFPVQCLVEWCKQRDERTWVASLEFQNLSEEKQRDLKAFLDDQKDRLKPKSDPMQ